MTRPLVTSFLGVAALLLAACDGGGDVRVVGTGGEEIDTTATTTSTITEPTAIPGATEIPSDTATATTTATAAATAEASPPPSSGSGAEPQPGDIEGVPFSTEDVRAAVEAERRVFLPVSDHERLCPSTGVPETIFWAASAGGSDYGPLWALWVYPDEASREAEWAFEDGRLDPRATGCELPTGFNYFNANAVMAFVAWSGLDGERLHDELRSPADDAAKQAFLAMEP